MFTNRCNTGRVRKTILHPVQTRDPFIQSSRNTPPKWTNVWAQLGLLGNVLNLAITVSSVLTILGIDSKKAGLAIAAITHFLVDFNEKFQDINGLKKTRHLRKDELRRNLETDCHMSPEEAKLTTAVAKAAFRAFYHKQNIRRYDPGFYSEADWKDAAQRTIEAYAKSGATQSELQLAAVRIQDAYNGYMERVATSQQPPIPNTEYETMRASDLYHCSIKKDYQRISEETNYLANAPLQQVTCQCCGCLKKTGNYHDSRGRSILYVDNNNLYYNDEPLRQGLHRLSYGTSCEAKLPVTICNQINDAISKAIKSINLEESLRESLNASYPRASVSSPFTNPKKEESWERTEYSSDECSRRKDSNKNIAFPKDSVEHISERHKVKLSDSDIIVEIALKGVCRKPKEAHPEIDILGLKLFNKDCDEVSEYVCKRRVCLANRYTQTGSKCPTPCLSESSTQFLVHPKTDVVSPKMKSSRTSAKKQSFMAQKRDSLSTESTTQILQKLTPVKSETMGHTDFHPESSDFTSQKKNPSPEVSFSQPKSFDFDGNSKTKLFYANDSNETELKKSVEAAESQASSAVMADAKNTHPQKDAMPATQSQLSVEVETQKEEITNEPQEEALHGGDETARADSD